jgi:HSP20 family protein
MVARRLFDFPFAGWQNQMTTMDQMAKQMDWLSKSVADRPGLRWFSSKVYPALNITEDLNKYYVRAELPGIKSDEIQLEITGRNLAISGERKIRSEGGNARYHRREREAGRFSRMVTLPGEIDANSASARMVNGLLVIEISKSDAAKPKKISVK